MHAFAADACPVSKDDIVAWCKALQRPFLERTEEEVASLDATLSPSIPFLSQLTKARRRMVLQLTFVMLLRQGEALFRVGEPSHSIFAVLNGQVRETHTHDGSITTSIASTDDTINYVRLHTHDVRRDPGAPSVCILGSTR